MAYPKLKDEYYSNIGGINEKVSIYKVGENEVLDLINYDFSEPGAWTKRWGFTQSLISGNTLTIGASQFISNIWQAFGQANRILFGHDQGVFKILGTIDGSAATMIYTSLISGLTTANWNYTNFTDQNYFSCGMTLPIYKYKPNTFGGVNDEASWFGMAQMPGVGLGGGPTTGGGGSFSGQYIYYFAYMDEFGFIGPRTGPYTINTSAGDNTIILSGFTTGNGPSFGYACYAAFRDRVAGFPSTDSVLYATFTGATFTDNNVASIGQFLDPIPANIYLGAIFGGATVYTYRFSKYLEMYNNRLFIDQDTNKVYFSETANPQVIFPENNFFVGDNRFPLSGFKTFNQGLLITCQKGIYRLTGDDPSSFNLQTVSTVFGNISHKSFVEFEEKLWWLDEMGPVEFDGARVQPVFNRVQDTFKRMNLVKARENAYAINVKERNEVWFCIPVDGSDVNNLIVVYDYYANGWTKFQNTELRPTAINYAYQSYTATMNFRLPERKYYYFGSLGASLYNFDSSLENDNNEGMTLTFRTRWMGQLGKSQTSQFRRFYLDYGPYLGATLTYRANMYADYASALITETFLMYPNSSAPQERLEFGVPAKALSVEVVHGSTTGKARIYGYTIESRFQRPV